MAQLPKLGRSRDEILRQMRERKSRDADWRGGRTWSLIYPAGEDVDEVLREANELYVFENALNPFRFPSLREMESEVVSMTTGLLNGGDGAGGAMTSGGTESILLAVKTARERAREERGVEAGGQILVPFSAHPAFAKAAQVLGLERVVIPLREDLRADLAAAEGLVNDKTVLLVGSAPNYPHGVIDPIPELAEIAAARGVHFHVDACVGGFILPFLERLGHRVPPFDFRVPGVSTISADVHKYGYCTKGASVIAHRDQSTLRHQTFLFDDWPGGFYGSTAMAGARPAAPVAAAWAVMSYLGEEGYLRLAKVVMETVEQLRRGIDAIEKLRIVGDPDASLLAFAADGVDVGAVGDVMDDRGWHLDRQERPAALHMMVTPNHAKVVDEFLEDLRFAVENAGESRGAQARYN